MIRIGLVAGTLLAAFAVLGAYEAVAYADGGPQPLATGAAAALGVLLTLPRGRRSPLVPLAAVAVAALAVHASGGAAPGAVFGVLAG